MNGSMDTAISGLMTYPLQAIVLIVALCAGAVMAVIAWVISRKIAEVPPENRQYKDPLPMGFRLVWWPILWIAHWLQPFMSAKTQSTLQDRLRRAGLEFCVAPAQFLGSRVVCAVLTGLLGLLVTMALNQPSAVVDPNSLSKASPIQIGISMGLFGFFYPTIWLRDRLDIRRREILKTLPFFLDIITLCIEAGLNLQGALNQAVQKGPKGVLRDEFQRVLRDVRAGKGRADSLRAMAERLNEPGIGNFCTSVIQAEHMGMNLGPVLRAQADQRRVERFLRAEKMAMEAPVKMLLPLIAFIFPCTFIVLFFPIVMKFMNSGL